MTLIGHEGAVKSLAYSPDGRLLASASTDGTVRVWDVRTGEEMISPLCSNDGAVSSVAFSPNGKNVVSGAENGTACVWSLSDAHGIPQRLNRHSGAVSSVLYSPDGSCLASASLNSAFLWNAETNQERAVLTGHSGEVHALAFSSDSRLLATGSEDQTIQIWDIATGKPKYTSCNPHRKPIYSLGFLPHSQKVAAGSGDDIILCKPKHGKNTVPLHSGSGPVISIDPSSDGLLLVSAYGNSVCLSTLPQPRVENSSVVLDGHTETVRAATFSHNGLYIASASDDRTIRIWNASGRAEVQPAIAQATDIEAISALIMSDSRRLMGHRSSVRSITVSPDGAVIVSGSDDHSVSLWDARTSAEVLPPLLGHTGSVHSVAISSDGRIVASGSSDNTIRLWDLQTGKPFGKPMQGHSSEVKAVVFSPNTLWLASGSNDKTVRIWDVATQKSSTVGPLFCDDSVLTVAVSPDGRLIAAGGVDGRISFWCSQIGQPAFQHLPTSLSHVNSIMFSPSGEQIVSGGWKRDGEQCLGIWDISTRMQVATLTGHSKGVNSAVYSLDGRFIGTASDDTTVRIWNAQTGEPIARMAGHRDWVQSVAFIPSGRSIVSCSDDSCIRIWDLTGAPGVFPVSDSDSTTLLHFATLHNGWLQAPTGELLVWVPNEYHRYLYELEGSRVVIRVDNSSLKIQGTSWASCWHADSSDPRFHAM